MTDPEPPPEPTPPPKPVPPPMPETAPAKPVLPAPGLAKPDQPAPPRPGRNPMAVLTAIGFALAFFGLAYLWQEIATMPRADSVDPARLANLESQIRILQQRLDVVERRPVAPAPTPAAPPDLRPLESRIAALEQRPAAPAPAPAPDLAPMEARIAAAETSARRALAQQSAAAALEAGRPLGPIPGAPPALARFAASPPPTLATLRQDFTAAAATAQAASVPAEPPGLAAQAWQRIAGLVTIRRGPNVLVGSPAAYIIGEARLKLDNGDIAGAIAVLDSLDPAAATAMAPWREKAQSLLDARAALASG